MPLKFYNTLTKQKEEFIPLDPPEVKMYVCGVTPYDEAHLGHGRAYVTFDVVRRYLEESGYQVTYIQNITDVDDKIIKKSNEERVTSNEIAEKYMDAYFEAVDKLNVKRADRYPKATEHIEEMIDWIGSLVEGGYAYVLDGDVYFEVEKFKGYGKLSKRNLEDMRSGARVAVDKRKKNPLDFALWKTAKEGEPSWGSPWGRGRPGWHIECSVMSTKYLGKQFDIHGGGLDLVFPHHENEIAQTEACTGETPWVKYWLHNGFVTVNKQKMSKSLGNFFTLKDIFRNFDPMVVRFFLLSTHYRSPINYSDKELAGAREAYGRIKKFVQDIGFLAEKSGEKAPSVEVKDLEEELQEFKDKFKEAMDDDLNTAGALAAVFELVRYCNKKIEKGEVEAECLNLMRQSVVDLCSILGLEIGPGPKAEGPRPEVERLIAAREDARKNRDFARADSIRGQLKEMGITIEDTPYGTRWSR